MGNHDRGVELGGEERSFRPIWKDEAGSYLRGIKVCGSSATEKREKRRNRKLEKSASQTRSIVDMFSIQRKRIESHDTNPIPDVALASPRTQALRGDKIQKVETLFESRTRAIHDLSKLLRLKTQQLDRSGHLSRSQINKWYKVFCRCN